jgi:hypothetical protein
MGHWQLRPAVSFSVKKNFGNRRNLLKPGYLLYDLFEK